MSVKPFVVLLIQQGVLQMAIQIFNQFFEDVDEKNKNERDQEAAQEANLQGLVELRERHTEVEQVFKLAEVVEKDFWDEREEGVSRC